MATSAKFPTAAATLADFGGELPGFPEAVLSGAHNNSVTTITLTATVPTAWPTAGWVTIDTEIIQYAGKSGATLTSCTRGAQSAYGGSVAASHADTAKVGFYLTPQVFNQALAEIIAVETQLITDGAQWTWSWLPGLAVQSDLTGTGTFANPTATIDSFVSLSTGATSGSLSGIRKQLRAASGVAGTNGVSRVRRWEFSYYSDVNANTNAYVFLTDENAATAPSLTARHLGLKQVGAVVSFTTADGSTEQATDVSAFFTTQTIRMCWVTFDGTTAKLYVDGTLRATHATNVPGTSSGTNPELHVTIANTSAAAQALQFGPTAARIAF